MYPDRGCVPRSVEKEQRPPVVSKNTNELKLGAPPTFSAALTQTPTMQELASVRRFLDGLCSGNNGSN